MTIEEQRQITKFEIKLGHAQKPKDEMSKLGKLKEMLKVVIEVKKTLKHSLFVSRKL